MRVVSQNLKIDEKKSRPTILEKPRHSVKPLFKVSKPYL
jgi:hypothetical protein